MNYLMYSNDKDALLTKLDFDDTGEMICQG